MNIQREAKGTASTITEPSHVVTIKRRIKNTVLNITLREGATRDMIRETIRHCLAAVMTMKKGEAEVPDEFQTRTYYPRTCEHTEARVVIYCNFSVPMEEGIQEEVSINKCHEETTAQELVTALWMLIRDTLPEE